MKQLFPTVICLISLTLGACNSNNETAGSLTAEDTAKPGMKIMIPGMVCYAGVVGKDSVFLKTERFPNVVTGSLQYNFNEKDDARGEIDGVLRSDTLVAMYTFGAEGKTSAREVAFLLTDSTAIEGYGPMEEKDGKMVFRNSSEIVFSQGFKLRVISCPQQ